MSTEVNIGEIENEQLALATESIVAPEVVGMDTAVLSGMDTMYRGRKLLAGAAVAVAALAGAEIPATHADAASRGFKFIKAWRIGCHADGRSDEFKAKFEFHNLEGKQLGEYAKVKGDSHQVVTYAFKPKTNDWRHTVAFHDLLGPHPKKIPAGHPKVSATLTHYKSGNYIAGPVEFKLPAC